MTFLSIVFDIISIYADNCGAVLTLISSASLATILIINTTIIDAPRDFDTIVAVVCGILTLLAIGCSGGNNRKTDGAGGTFAYEFGEIDRGARPPGAAGAQQQGGKIRITTTMMVSLKDGLKYSISING